MGRKHSLAIDEKYHVYNRGTDKRLIFLDDQDKERFINLLYLCNSSKRILVKDIPKEKIYDLDRKERLVDIGAYCLMPNHFHLLLRQNSENGVSLFMQKLTTGYTMYFNKKYKRTGALFEGRFKAVHADQDRYVQYLFSYIHLNPIKIKRSDWKEAVNADIQNTKIFLENYRYSSYLDFLGDQRKEKVILNKEMFPEYFAGRKKFEDFIYDWLEIKAFTPEVEPQGRI